MIGMSQILLGSRVFSRIPMNGVTRLAIVMTVGPIYLGYRVILKLLCCWIKRKETADKDTDKRLEEVVDEVVDDDDGEEEVVMVRRQRPKSSESSKLARPKTWRVTHRKRD